MQFDWLNVVFYASDSWPRYNPGSASLVCLNLVQLSLGVEVLLEYESGAERQFFARIGTPPSTCAFGVAGLGFSISMARWRTQSVDKFWTEGGTRLSSHLEAIGSVVFGCH